MMEKSLLEKRCYDIDENLKYIEEKIAKAAQQSGRQYEDIHFMAVTKTVAPALINHAIAKGIRLIGENKVQELLSKEEQLHLDHCDVHLIGHLQTNKVKQVVSHVSMIQSVDSFKVAQEIAKQATKIAKNMPILLEVNIGKEESKSGFQVEELASECMKIAQLDGVKVEGLMAIPPICEDLSQNRRHFSIMNKLFVDIREKKLDNVNMNILSMGMSDDYEAAILEGSNLVRIGSAIFGARQYN